MSIVPSSGTGIAAVDDDDGLGDFDESEVVIPRLNIKHDGAVFVDSLTNEESNPITVVLLGLVKQRTLWPPEMQETPEAPLCRSYDAVEGHPGEKFPWKATPGFQAPVVGAEPPCLSCGSCPLKEWGSQPKGDPKSPPWCNEQFVFPLLMQPTPGNWAPALLTIQRSSLTAAKAYVSGFKRSKRPMFTALTTLTLNQLKRGTVSYSTVTFTKSADTDETQWAESAHTFRSIRDFIKTPRADQPTEEEAPVATAPAASQVATATAAGGDLPF